MNSSLWIIRLLNLKILQRYHLHFSTFYFDFQLFIFQLEEKKLLRKSKKPLEIKLEDIDSTETFAATAIDNAKDDENVSAKS